MRTVGDLLAHYPRRYAKRGELTPISSLPVGEPVTIVAEVMAFQSSNPRAFTKPAPPSQVAAEATTTFIQ